MAVGAFLRGRPVARPNPDTAPDASDPPRWHVARFALGPGGATWAPVGGGFERREDAEAELVAPAGLFAPGDVVRVILTASGDAAVWAWFDSAYWSVGADGRGRRLPALSAYFGNVELADWYGEDWAGAWAGLTGAELLALAEDVSLDRRALARAAAHAVQGDVEASLGTGAAAPAVALVARWCEGDAADDEVDAARRGEADRVAVARDPDSESARRALVRLLDACAHDYVDHCRAPTQACEYAADAAMFAAVANARAAEPPVSAPPAGAMLAARRAAMEVAADADRARDALGRRVRVEAGRRQAALVREHLPLTAFLDAVGGL